MFTDDRASVARIWEVSSGKLLSETDPRHRYISELPTPSELCPGAVQISDNRLVTRTRIEGVSDMDIPFSDGVEIAWKGPVELWDTQTGRLIARLDGPEDDVGDFIFAAGGKWVTTTERKSMNGAFVPTTVVIYSSQDGRVVARLPAAEGEWIDMLDVSPAGKRLVVRHKDSNDGPGRTVVWNAGSWKSQVVPIRYSYSYTHWFLSDDLYLVDNGGRGESFTIDFTKRWSSPGRESTTVQLWRSQRRHCPRGSWYPLRFKERPSLPSAKGAQVPLGTATICAGRSIRALSGFKLSH